MLRNKDDGEVIGQDTTDATIRQVASWISDKVEPSISPTIERLTGDDGETYIRVAFSGVDAPYSADGRYFTRVGTSNKQMAASELTAMIIGRDRARNPWDSLPSGRPLEDIDEAAVREFVEMGKAAGRIGDGPTDAAGGLKQRNPAIAQALFRSGMIEQYGTGIPRIKRYCDAEGVKFGYRQTVSTTIIRFDRPGAQIVEEVPSGTESAKKAQELEGPFDLAEATAMRIARKNGRVTKRQLMEEADVGKMKATETLKMLADRGALEWVGTSTNDPRQYYRPVGID